MNLFITKIFLFTMIISSFARNYSYAASVPAPVPPTGQTLCYSSTGLVKPCAGTGQDAAIQKGVLWPDPRFNDHGNGTVTDKLTGLMWTKDANLPLAPKTWQLAFDYVAGMNAGTIANFGYTDWRLPSIRELQGLSDMSRVSPALPANHPFTSVQSIYVSGSSTSSYTDGYWFIIMGNGQKTYFSKTGVNDYVWPVRSGQILVPAAPAPTPKTGQTISYTAWDDGSLQPGVAWPAPRFADNGDGSVTDNLTGLIWLKNAGCFAAQNWDAALTSANTLAEGSCGLSDASVAGDWHLPDKNELLSLIDYGASTAALPAGHPFTSVQSTVNYWSATTYTFNPGSAWRVSLLSGSEDYGSKSDNRIAWPVRMGQLIKIPLTLKVEGTGGGSVNGGISCMSGKVCAPYLIIPGTAISLYATPDKISTFAGWTGDCTGIGNCNVTMNGAKTVSATFSAAPKAMITTTKYASFAEANAAASISTRTTIMLLEDFLPLGTVISKSLTLRGGYLPTFSRSATGYTTLKGPLIIRSGTLIMDRVAVR